MSLSRYCTIDIESNGLLSDMLDYRTLPYKLKRSARLWCVVITNCETLESVELNQQEITKEALQEALKDYDFIIAHNGIKFDFPALSFFGVFDYEIGYLGQRDKMFGREVTFVDTLVLSRLLHPDRYGGHSLESWGERLGVPKTDFRGLCIEKGYITAKAPKGAEFWNYVPEMSSYCIGDTITNVAVFKELWAQFASYKGWRQAMRMESKLADLGLRRENFGFWFDKDLAVKCVEELTGLMEMHKANVNPILPPRPMNKGELKEFTPPKNQLIQSGALSSHMRKFLERTGSVLTVHSDLTMTFEYEGKTFPIPCTEPIKTHTEPDISNLDHVKSHLINLGWVPTEWRERDLTKDAKKVNLTYKKRLEALDRYLEATFSGKYKKERMEILGLSEHNARDILAEKLKGEFPVRVPTSPSVRVGVVKEVCPNLVALGEKVDFARDFSLFLTYKHRKSSIAGGVLEDVDYEEEYPETGFLSNYRQEDNRIPTPAIEIGSNTHRYRHIGVSNIPRVNSVYGDKLRSLFGCKPGRAFFAFDFSSLEARIEGHYIWDYKGGPELAAALLAEKPYDLHTLTAQKHGISRDSGKTLNYSIIYGANYPKIAKSLGISQEEAKELLTNYWDGMPALKSLKEDITQHWLENNKEWIKGIDGRQIRTRSPHSLLNCLLQSGGVICAKYTTIFINQAVEEAGYNTNPFVGEPDFCSMIEVHDEADYEADSKFFEFKTFDTKEEAEAFKASWEGEPLSGIVHGKKYFVTLPNKFSKIVADSIDKTCKLLDLKVPLGFEFLVGKNWKQAH
jgi:hypothetical protein